MILLHKVFSLLAIMLLMGGGESQLRTMNKPNDVYVNLVATEAGDTRATVIFNYSDNEYMGMVFGPSGPNNTTYLDSIFTGSKNIALPLLLMPENRVEILKSCTDWIGPMIVRKVSGNQSKTPFFTGGWHVYLIGDIEQNTAKSQSVEISIDGKKMSVGSSRFGKQVEINVINKIYGYNSEMTNPDDYVIRENVLYTITPRKIEVEVELYSLQNAVIETYYGLQSQNSAWLKTVSYRDANGSLLVAYDAKKSSDVFTLPGQIIEQVNIANEVHHLSMQLDNSYGLGNLEYLSETFPSAFTRDYGKSYFNLINGIELELSENESVRWRGMYIFSTTE